MSWYDRFAPYYDVSVERLYVAARREAVATLALPPGARVLDAPCGTGHSLALLTAAVGPSGSAIGVDLSTGMLHRAQQRAGPGASCLAADVRALTHDEIGGPVDALHLFLGLSVFADWESAFDNLFSLLKPGGKCVVVDVYNAKPGLQGRMVEWVAGADLTRPTWAPLARYALDFERRELPGSWQLGGALFLASGTKAR